MLALVALRIVIGFVAIPVPVLTVVVLAVSVLFVAAPIYGLFRAASAPWNWKRAAIFLVGGLVVWAGLAAVAARVASPLWSGLSLAVAQQALVVWCLGIGALLALLLRDRNMLLPVAIFLALFDLWLVLSPMGLVNQSVVQGSGEALANVAYQVPAPQRVSGGGKAAPLAYVGPADYLFLSMFFVCLFRFGMRIRETFRWSVPVLALYLLVVLLFGWVRIGPIALGALPALVPIGLVVLIVNRGEFRLGRDERLATWVLTLGGGAFVIWSIFGVPAPPAEPLTTPPGQEASGSPQSPSPSGPSQPPSGSPPDAGSTPGPR
jgi:hypothetical protein